MFRSIKHIYIQAIDDKKGETIASLSSIDKSLKSRKLGNKCHQALIIGQTFGEILIKKGDKKKHYLTEVLLNTLDVYPS